MRIESVKMAWFRGAAVSVSLDTTSKSVVAYGENGAGKSSFVDAVEFLMSDGKISSEAFREHVSEEKKRLHDILEIFNSRTAAVGVLSDSVKSLKSAYGKPDVKSWRDALANGDHDENLKCLDAANAEDHQQPDGNLRRHCGAGIVEAALQGLDLQ